MKALITKSIYSSDDFEYLELKNVTRFWNEYKNDDVTLYIVIKDEEYVKEAKATAIERGFDFFVGGVNGEYHFVFGDTIKNNIHFLIK